jgi:LacI family transcriptional regulator
MLENRVRAVAVMTSQFDRELQAQLTSKNVPLVALAADAASRNRSIIDIDWPSGIADAVRHLHRLGHRNIALATGPQDQISAIAHRESVVKALHKLGTKPVRILEGDHRPESGAEAAHLLLSDRERPTAIFCGNDRMAIGAIGMARDLGFRVPEDVSILGSDDLWIARYSNPPLTTVRIPRDTLGQLAFDVLMKMLRSKRRTGEREVLKTELIIRASTAPPTVDESVVRPAKQRTGRGLGEPPETELAG